MLVRFSTDCGAAGAFLHSHSSSEALLSFYSTVSATRRGKKSDRFFLFSFFFYSLLSNTHSVRMVRWWCEDGRLGTALPPFFFKGKILL